MRYLALFLLIFGAVQEEESGAIQEVLNYWFGELRGREDYPEAKAQIWFRKSEQTDNEIRARFGTLVVSASKGELVHWTATPEGRLALIIVTDQFTRNIYRNDPRAFSCDGMAQKLASDGLKRGDDVKLPFVQRVFFYLPFEHAEDLTQQRLAVQKYQELATLIPNALKATYESYLDYAMKHQAMIERFGRFPHRNQVLGRKSTAEEEAFLRLPGSSF